MSDSARIIASHGRAYIIELPDGRRLSASARGKKTDFACGDNVAIKVLNDEQAVIEKALERKTLLYRSDQWRSKLIAANVTQIAIVVAPVPSYLDELIGRTLLAAESQDIEPLIVLNKCDLPEAVKAREALRYYETLGYPLLALSAKEDVSPLRAKLQGHTSVLVGQSGMGKSTLLNALIPEARARVNDISTALDTGKHTTTHATLYHLDEQSALIDSPGVQSFGLAHLKEETLPNLMPDLRPYVGQCRFHNCRHRHEPDCAILNAAKSGAIAQSRMDLLHRLQDELAQVSTW
ncbi:MULTISPECIES: ribosome small subunit-dependent GTPase A [Silvimonas]|uniref:ribosome small subunit-dependent GTPase A n=1 Tax=Silvimonas TaxID=300264 RepID=UPI0024B354AA|nr:MULTISPECIES: ribosome small subunit-dependent GTPase A [Silvimonas]MDR3427430.1 ribosome small subunit-dependent GTPase A [Silvimonas sp.]